MELHACTWSGRATLNQRRTFFLGGAEGLYIYFGRRFFPVRRMIFFFKYKMCMISPPPRATKYPMYGFAFPSTTRTGDITSVLY